MKLSRPTPGAIVLALLMSSASAAEEIVVKTDQTQMLSVTGNPGAVVIGNPSIADATVHGSKVFIHGRGFGTTNLTILDLDGNQISSFDVVVQVGGDNNVAVFKAANRYSFVCVTLCENQMQVGDQFEWTDNIIKLNQKKMDLATGKTSASSQSAPAE